MNYQGTKSLLDVISPYIDPDNILLGEVSRDLDGGSPRSDVAVLVGKNKVGFEVSEDQISISYFSGRETFEDGSSELKKGEPDRFERAGEFLVRLFTLPIRHTAVWRGKKLGSEQYCFLHPSGKEECYGVIVEGFRLFRRKRMAVTTWQYDPNLACFTNSLPWQPDPEALEVIEMAGRYIEIFRKGSAYAFNVWQKEVDDYEGLEHWYWVPLDSGRASFFDTREKAVTAAKEMLKLMMQLRGAANPASKQGRDHA